jgi:hypothetical protein
MSQPPYPGQYPDQPQSGQPYQGGPYQGGPYQPYPGQPNPDVPASVPPQPGFPPPPSYGQQPGYPPQPDYAGYGQPMPPPKKSRALPIVLISIAVVLVLCVGGGTAAFLLVRNTSEDIVDSYESAAPTVEPTTEPTTPPTTEPTESGRTITISEPSRLGGRPKLTDDQFAGVADQLQSELSQVPGATNTVGALYGTPAKRDIVIIAAVEAPVADPQKELDGTFFGAGVGGLKVSGIVDVEPGPLGGGAKCGKTESAGVDLAFCAWADEGSVGWIMWYFKTVKQVSGEFAKLRGEIEKAS